jgi:hypothetical protein
MLANIDDFGGHVKSHSMMYPKPLNGSVHVCVCMNVQTGIYIHDRIHMHIYSHATILKM